MTLNLIIVLHYTIRTKGCCRLALGHKLTGTKLGGKTSSLMHLQLKKIAHLTHAEQLSGIIDTSDGWVCSLKLLVNKWLRLWKRRDFTFKFGEFLGNSLSRRQRCKRVEMSPHRDAPSCDVVTDVTGQIDAPFLSYGTGTEMFVVIRCYASTPSSERADTQRCLFFVNSFHPALGSC